ncbi:flavin reductase [Agrobacterium sp. rho-13.3]|jgi:flavin reductase|uniref:flavin reductase n=1 Tax=Agrobacterium sp. rho-13.3 TaxID=3072980 RepID=UPI002A0CF809|nr:flavin reductase [Agrobacterium sp. rho-13.3]MDX8308228.1 flavin reductase [Agrobacterium sp. rho-13.3]
MQTVSLKKEAAMDTKTAEQRSLDYRNAMSQLAGAVNIVTTDGPAGRAGFAATAVCSVSDSPPTLLVCLNRNSSAHKFVVGNGVVCINTLAADQEQLSGLFGGKTPMDARFEAGEWTTQETGSPLLHGALVSFDCRIRTIHDGGTHDILICEVLDTIIRDGEEALIYFKRAYRHL